MESGHGRGCGRPIQGGVQFHRQRLAKILQGTQPILQFTDHDLGFDHIAVPGNAGFVLGTGHPFQVLDEFQVVTGHCQGSLQVIQLVVDRFYLVKEGQLYRLVPLMFTLGGLGGGRLA